MRRGGARSRAESFGVRSRKAEAAAPRGRGRGRRAHGAPRPRRQRAPSGLAALKAPQRLASNPRPKAMPVMKGLLAPQNTFLDTIATRFDGTREWGGGWGWGLELGPRPHRHQRWSPVCAETVGAETEWS